MINEICEGVSINKNCEKDTLTISRSVELSTLLSLKKYFDNNVSSGRIVIDLSEVPFGGSHLCEMINQCRTVYNGQENVRLVVGDNDMLRENLEMVGFGALYGIYTTLDEANGYK